MNRSTDSTYGRAALRAVIISVASLVLSTLILVSAGCDQATGKLARPIDAPPPRHPAMAQRPGTPSPSPSAGAGHSPHDGHDHGATGLPPGHPPTDQRAPASGTRNSAGGSAPAIDDNGRMRAAGLSFVVPEGWENQPPSMSMRLAQFGLPRAGQDAEDGVLTVIPSRGGVKGNVARWQTQFAENPEIQAETREVGDLRVTVVRLEGTYWGMSKGFRKPDFMLIGGIVEVPGSDVQVFFKGTGPRATMQHWSDSVDQLVGSLRTD